MTGLACAEVLEEKGVKAEGSAGFSLGEIAAASFCGIMEKSQGFDFVCLRGRVMQLCAEEHRGAMFAVMRLPDSQVESICASLKQT